METALVENLTLPQIHRIGTIVKIDTWGGDGTMYAADGEAQDASRLAGTLTLNYVHEADAQKAEAILREWSRTNALVTVHASNDGARLANQETGQIVGSL